jgi:hypothetical protein
VRDLSGRLAATAIKLGIGDERLHLLVVQDPNAKDVYMRPVTVISVDGEQWLVSPFGEVRWVRDVRAGTEVSLRRGFRLRSVELSPVVPVVAAPVLREYLRQVPAVDFAFAAGPDSPLQEFTHQADRHPVFRLAFDTPS